MSESPLRVVVTGASGLLGSQVLAALCQLPSMAVTGLCHSRPRPDLTPLDVTDRAATAALLNGIRPHFVIHAAAQRFPDKVEKDHEAAVQLNVVASRHIASLCRELGATMVYISTDYVFDGTASSYSHTAPPCPTNRYGETKLAGEAAVREESPDSLVLRIPVLYGPVSQLSDSAVTVLLDLVRKRVPAAVSSYEVRCPAHTGDVAAILGDIVTHSPALQGGVYQWSGLEKLSKWDMVLLLSSELGLDISHLTEQAGPSGGAPRPRDVELCRSRLEDLGISHHRPFRQGLLEVLGPHL